MCCGCEACKNICPQNCIEMLEDEEGFIYPQVDKEKCIKCGLCERVCQYKNNVSELKKHKEEHLNPGNLHSLGNDTQAECSDLQTVCTVEEPDRVFSLPDHPEILLACDPFALCSVDLDHAQVFLIAKYRYRYLSERSQVCTHLHGDDKLSPGLCRDPKLI